MIRSRFSKRNGNGGWRGDAAAIGVMFIGGLLGAGGLGIAGNTSNVWVGIGGLVLALAGIGIIVIGKRMKAR